MILVKKFVYHRVTLTKGMYFKYFVILCFNIIIYLWKHRICNSSMKFAAFYCRFILDNNALVRELNTTSSSPTVQADNNISPIMIQGSNLLEPAQLGW